MINKMINKMIDLNDIEVLAIQLMTEHGLINGKFNGSFDWTFGWNNQKSTYGLCHYSSRKIELSRILTPLCSPEQINDTILHEIAHALAGVHNGHNKIWKDKAISIGCSGTRCGDYNVLLKCKWIATCPKCNHIVYKHRQANLSCGICTKTYNPKYKLQWTLNEE